MKLYTMSCIHDPEHITEGDDYFFVKLETKDEDNKYSDTVGGLAVSYQDYEDWDDYMICQLGEEDATTDDDVYFYIRANEPDVEVGGTYTDADGLVWERIY